MHCSYAILLIIFQIDGIAGNWRPSSLSELTLIIFHMELTHLSLKDSNCLYDIKFDSCKKIFYHKYHFLQVKPCGMTPMLFIGIFIVLFHYVLQASICRYYIYLLYIWNWRQRGDAFNLVKLFCYDLNFSSFPSNEINILI